MSWPSSRSNTLVQNLSTCQALYTRASGSEVKENLILPLNTSKLIKWLIDWLVDWLTDWLDWLTGLTDWLTDWLTGLTDWLDWLTGLTDWLTVGLIDSLNDWMRDWLCDWLIDRWIACLIRLFIHSFIHSFIHFFFQSFIHWFSVVLSSLILQPTSKIPRTIFYLLSNSWRSVVTRTNLN